MRTKVELPSGEPVHAAGLPILLPLELAITTLKNLAGFLLHSGLALSSPLYVSARIAEHFGLRKAASTLYALALKIAESSASSSTFHTHQLWEFLANRNLSGMGSARVEDPLFNANASPDPESTLRGRARSTAAGYYQARLIHLGLRMDGYLRPGMGQVRIDVLVDGRLLKSTTPTMLPLRLPFFVINIRRNALSMLPASARLELRLATGEPLLHNGSTGTLLELPHGLSPGMAWQQPVTLDKKGFLIQGTSDTETLQREFLRIYRLARDFFDQHLGTPLFLLYGTLLGQHRGQDFIPGDDDFDVGYYSDIDTSAGIRSQGMDFVVKLVRAGFVVTINRQGRLFRLRLPGMPPECHLDVHAVWRERESLWIHPQANLDCSREDFLPVRKAMLRDVEVTVPARPEAFLAAYYGAGWRLPDPTYSTVARSFPRWKHSHLRRSCVTPAHVQEMQRLIAEDPAPDTGMLIAIGTQTIYPLDRYEALCDW